MDLQGNLRPGLHSGGSVLPEGRKRGDTGVSKFGDCLSDHRVQVTTKFVSEDFL